MKTLIDYAKAYLEAHRSELTHEQLKECEASIAMAEHEQYLQSGKGGNG